MSPIREGEVPAEPHKPSTPDAEIDEKLHTTP